MKRAVLAVWAVACGPRPEHPRVAEILLQQADLDGSGAVEPAEFSQLAFPSEGFAPYDLDSNGLLDAYELERAFLSTSPSDFQDEGRMEVHRKYGHPFGRPGGQTEGKGPRGKGAGGKAPRGKGAGGKAPRGKGPGGKGPRGKGPGGKGPGGPPSQGGAPPPGQEPG